MDNKQRIINQLGKNTDHPFTMREISIATKIPYATLHRTLATMTDLIHTQKVGQAKIITLQKEHDAMKAYLTVSSNEEKQQFLKKQPIIKKIANELATQDIVLLFGSYAKKTEKESSDIDLLIINKKGDKTLHFTKYEHLFKKNINPIFITKKEFTTMLKDTEENVGKQALKNHIILQHPEQFWECVLHG